MMFELFFNGSLTIIHIISKKSRMIGYSNINHRKSSSDFIDHLRNLFVAIDDERICEYSLVPDLNASWSSNELQQHKLDQDMPKWKLELRKHLDFKNYDSFRNLGLFKFFLFKFWVSEKNLIKIF